MSEDDKSHRPDDVKRAVNLLTPEERLAMHNQLYGIVLEELAASTGLSIETICRRKRAAMKKFRDAFPGSDS